MVRHGQLRHCQQHKELRNFVDKFDLNTITPEQEQQPHVLQEILNNHNSRYGELPRRMKKRKERTADAQQHGGQVSQSNTLEGCVDHLLILAQSAEIVEQSEDGVARTNVNNQNKDQESSGELFDSSLVVSHVSTQRCEINYEDARPRLTQVRKQARCKYLTLDEERDEDKQCKHLQRKKINLSQTKHQARCRSKNNFPQKEIITVPRIEMTQGRILRLSKIKHLARSKGNSTVKDGFKDDMNKNQHCNTYKDSNLSMFECVPTHNVFTVKWDDENLQKLQRTARRLRAFKTQKLRQRLRTQCIGNSANKRLDPLKISPISLTSTTNSLFLSDSTMLLTAKDSVATNQELPEPSGINGKLGRNIGAAELKGHFGSSGFIYKSYQHIPNFKKNHQVVAGQHKIDHIEEKQTLKDELQNAKNHVHENSDALMEFMPVKRLRLTHLRREVRSRNQCSVVEAPFEN